MLICGADGCRAGWVAITKDLDSGEVCWRLCTSAHELFYQTPAPQVIAIDIPIGLPESGSRACDHAARRLLGPGRASSVFPAPVRPVLAATSYAEACAIHLRADGKSMSCQAWNIVPKIREVDLALRQDAELRSRIFESHPEVSFARMAGHPLRHGKKHKDGRTERRQLLEPIFGCSLQDAIAARHELGAVEDDVLDAFVVLWTARRIADGTHETLPATPETDSCGLRMEIVV